MGSVFGMSQWTPSRVLTGSPWAVMGARTPASHVDTCIVETQIQEGWIAACISMQKTVMIFFSYIGVISYRI